MPTHRCRMCLQISSRSLEIVSGWLGKCYSHRMLSRSWSVEVGLLDGIRFVVTWLYALLMVFILVPGRRKCDWARRKCTCAEYGILWWQLHGLVRTHSSSLTWCPLNLMQPRNIRCQRNPTESRYRWNGPFWHPRIRIERETLQSPYLHPRWHFHRCSLGRRTHCWDREACFSEHPRCNGRRLQCRFGRDQVRRVGLGCGADCDTKRIGYATWAERVSCQQEGSGRMGIEESEGCERGKLLCKLGKVGFLVFSRFDDLWMISQMAANYESLRSWYSCLLRHSPSQPHLCLPRVAFPHHL